jgi:hypothetical protein
MVAGDIALLPRGILIVVQPGAACFKIVNKVLVVISSSSLDNILGPMFISDGESAMWDRTIATVGQTQ